MSKSHNRRGIGKQDKTRSGSIMMAMAAPSLLAWQVSGASSLKEQEDLLSLWKAKTELPPDNEQSPICKQEAANRA